MRLTEKLEHYIFQWFFHTAALREQCKYITEIYRVLTYNPSVVVVPSCGSNISSSGFKGRRYTNSDNRIDASRLCESAWKILFHAQSDASSYAAMRLTEKIEHYIFQWFFHTAALRVQCKYIIVIYRVLAYNPSVVVVPSSGSNISSSGFKGRRYTNSSATAGRQVHGK